MATRKICRILIVVLIAFSHWSAKKAPSEVSLAWENAPRAIDPRFTVDAYSHYLSDLMNCSLITFNESGQIIGNLAKKWQWLDNKTLQVEMRPDATFSNGAKVTAADVKATYDFFKNEKLTKPSPMAGAFKTISAIDVKGPQITFKFSEADTSFLQNLMIGILPASEASNEMYEDPGSFHTCGPFVLTAMNVNGLTLSRNPRYSLGEPATVDRIHIKIVKDELTRFSKLRKGEVDLIQDNISREKIPSIAKEYPSLQVTKRPGLNTTYLGFNMRDKVVSNPKVRRAIALAIKRNDIIEYIFKGMAVPANTLLTPDDPFLNPDLKPIDYNVAEAKRHLDEAGFKDPDGDGPKPRFEISYKTTTNVTRVTIAQAIASQLRDVGIKVNVEALEWGKFKSDVDAGRVQMWSLAWVGFKDPDIYRYAFASENFPPNGGNRGWFSHQKLDQILAEAKTEADSGKRKQLYFAAQKIIAEELPYVFLWHEEIFAVHHKRIQGFTLYADGRLTALTRVKVK